MPSEPQTMSSFLPALLLELLELGTVAQGLRMRALQFVVTAQ